MGQPAPNLEHKLRTWVRTSDKNEEYWSHDAEDARVYYPARFGWKMMSSISHGVIVDQELRQLHEKERRKQLEQKAVEIYNAQIAQLQERPIDPGLPVPRKQYTLMMRGLMYSIHYAAGMMRKIVNR